VARKRAVEVRRGSAVVFVRGRALALSAPVRQQKGEWLVPADLLLRALPAVLGAGVHVTVSAPPARPAPPRPAVRAVSAPSRTAAVPRPPPPPAPREGDSPPPPPAGEPAPPPPASVAPSRAAPPEPARPAAVKAGDLELRYRSYPGYTRVVLEGVAPFEPRLIESGDTLLVPLAGLSGAPPRAVRAIRDGLLDSLELTQSRGMPTLRVSFERSPAARKVFRLQDPPRLVLDFYRGQGPPAAPAATDVITVVLDAGHGGHDPGAVGPGGLMEKDLTLDLARRVAAHLGAEGGMKVVLTRSRDQFLPLRERTTIANRHRGDVFVSIHVNAAAGATATGTETYFLSSEATDNAARAAAAFENKVIALEGNARGGTRDVLRTILWDLAQSQFQQESSRLAESLQDGLDRALRQPSRGVKQAPFYVLGGAAMPAVLVEVGFVSNPQEEQRLQDEGYRDRVARALAAGVAAYKRGQDRKGGVVVGR
jgi:N-acetylmuramoyl-L-alanine amidase